MEIIKHKNTVGVRGLREGQQPDVLGFQITCLAAAHLGGWALGRGASGGRVGAAVPRDGELLAAPRGSAEGRGQGASAGAPRPSSRKDTPMFPPQWQRCRGIQERNKGIQKRKKSKTIYTVCARLVPRFCFDFSVLLFTTLIFFLLTSCQNDSSFSVSAHQFPV